MHVTGRVLACGLLAALAVAAKAQAPGSPGSPAGQPPATPVKSEQDKAGGDAPRPAAHRSAGTRPGFTPAPMNIRIQEEGVKLPKCAVESREGEACKK